MTVNSITIVLKVNKVAYVGQLLQFTYICMIMKNLLQYIGNDILPLISSDIRFRIPPKNQTIDLYTRMKYTL